MKIHYKILTVALFSLMASLTGTIYADECPNPNNNFVGAGLLGGGGQGQITCFYSDHSQKLLGTYQVFYLPPDVCKDKGWCDGEGDFGGYCGNNWGNKVRPASFCFIRFIHSSKK